MGTRRYEIPLTYLPSTRAAMGNIGPRLWQHGLPGPNYSPVQLEQARFVSSLLYRTRSKLVYWIYRLSKENIHGLRLIPWWSEWQNPDQERTNENHRINHKTDVCCDFHRFFSWHTNALTITSLKFITNRWAWEQVPSLFQALGCWGRAKASERKKRGRTKPRNETLAAPKI